MLGRLSFGANSSVIYNYNEANQTHTLGRLNSAEINAGEKLILNSKLTFEPGDPGTGSTTSNRVSRLDNNGNTIDYTYDQNGNIKTITYEKGKANEKTTEYFYDALNQLIRENNQILDKTIKYNYDNGGNILSKEYYAYTGEETPINPANVYSYTYDSVWKDKLTSYDGKAIISDETGNTTGYDGWTLAWDRGRELASMAGNGKTLSFTYNEDGIRTTKTVDGVTTKYYLIGDAVAYETNGIDNIYYTYGTDNNLISMNLNGEEYYYVRNAQNDIIGLLDSDKVQVASYTYDSWGKLISITDKDGNDVTDNTTHIGYKNPYRYRGYHYDNETGLYSLHTRYYDPTIGRFINADNTDILDGGNDHMLENNLFAYCFNNPVNITDEDGQWPSWATKVLIGTAVIAALAIVTVCTAGTGTVLAAVAVGALQGAVTGAAVGAASGAAIGAVSHRVTTGSWKGAGGATLNGAATGYMMGAITGAVTGGINGYSNYYNPPTTAHGAQQLAARGFSKADIKSIKGTNIIKTQADGAHVYIKSLGNGKYSYIAQGKNGEITGLKNISKGSLDRLAKNYGWK